PTNAYTRAASPQLSSTFCLALCGVKRLWNGVVSHEPAFTNQLTSMLCRVAPRRIRMIARTIIATTTVVSVRITFPALTRRYLDVAVMLRSIPGRRHAKTLPRGRPGSDRATLPGLLQGGPDTALSRAGPGDRASPGSRTACRVTATSRAS